MYSSVAVEIISGLFACIQRFHRSLFFGTFPMCVSGTSLAASATCSNGSEFVWVKSSKSKSNACPICANRAGGILFASIASSGSTLPSPSTLALPSSFRPIVFSCFRTSARSLFCACRFSAVSYLPPGLSMICFRSYLLMVVSWLISFFVTCSALFCSRAESAAFTTAASRIEACVSSSACFSDSVLELSVAALSALADASDAASVGLKGTLRYVVSCVEAALESIRIASSAISLSMNDMGRSGWGWLLWNGKRKERLKMWITSYKSYAGLSSRSVRTAWEQHDKQETEVATDVYTKLAEDATYKLWELTNSIKTYSRHSSGRVTFDLVNEVLKDSDVPPIVGANSQPWDKIEYDGAYFFNSDEVLDLREEYIKHISLEQHNVPVLTTTWMAEADIAEDLIAMHNNICDAIFIGDEACFNTAIDILQYNRHTPSLMKLLLTKAIEMLGFEYTEATLRRTLVYLEALVQNYHVAHSDLTLELSLLSQLFVNLLVGPAGYVHAKLMQPNVPVPRPVTSLVGSDPQQQPQQQQQQQQQQQVLDNISPLFNNPMALLENNLPPAEDSNNSNSNATEELLRSIENIKDGADGIDLNNKDDYEALFSMVLGKQEGVDEGMVGTESMADGVVDGFQVKSEFDPEAFEANASNFIVQQASGSVVGPGGHTTHPGTLADPGMLTNEMLNSLAASAAAAAAATGASVNSDMAMFHIKPDPGKPKLDSGTPPTIIDADPEENVSLPMSESSDGGGEVNNPNSTTLESENITTLICEDYLVDGVCRVVGLCASKWGFVEQECTFLLVERLQRYFQERKTATVDYNWLSRIFRGLWAIGEFALRELLPYFYYIDSQTIPECLVPHFNTAGIFMNGRSDIFFYEYLYDICGDSLGPFMFSYDRKCCSL
uniref:Uncharacterized protein n=1 Tax=Anopheles melas TaxID=34690 RepID=A0A182UFX6_9DIPT